MPHVVLLFSSRLKMRISPMSYQKPFQHRLAKAGAPVIISVLPLKGVIGHSSSVFLSTLPVRRCSAPRGSPPPIPRSWRAGRYLMRARVPEAAGVGGNLVGQQDLAMVAAKLQLEVDELNVDLPHTFLEDLVDPHAHLLHAPHLLRRGKPHGGDVREVDQRVLQLRVLQAVFHHRVFQPRAVRVADAPGQAPRHDVSHLDGHGMISPRLMSERRGPDAADEMVGYALLRQQGEHVLTNKVVDLTLSIDIGPASARETQRSSR